MHEVTHSLRASINMAERRGVARESIVIDPGIGFGKSQEQNLELIAKLDQLIAAFPDYPLLIGTSRKSFIGRILADESGTPAPAEARLHGSLATLTAAILHGAHIVRVHDVKATAETIRVSESIRENLLFVNPEASESFLQECLDKAACQSLLSRADKGLDTVIGEGGLKLSGGERQRLSIARALLRKPRVLLFDEATSALDSITEEDITTTIREISAGRAQITILIAHRLSTIMHADRIYVLEQGEIVEQGDHTSLLEEKGLYYAMWRQQIGERRKQKPGTSTEVKG